MEMKGIIEHSILCEDAEIYRGRVRQGDSEREGEILRDTQSENDSGLNSLPDSAPELTAEAGVHQEQQGKGHCQLRVRVQRRGFEQAGGWRGHIYESGQNGNQKGEMPWGGYRV